MSKKRILSILGIIAILSNSITSFAVSPNFEDVVLPVVESNETIVDYMEPDAFSLERVAEGKEVFEEKCGVCHALSGKDMVMFGGGFNSGRVIGSVKKFAGAMEDPESGEKVYEYLRYTFPGPFQEMNDPFLQPGPNQIEPGAKNPVLTNPSDFWGALTGHKAPTVEDMMLDNFVNKYDWTKTLSNVEYMSWNDWMPNFIPPADIREPLTEYIEKNGFDTDAAKEGWDIYKKSKYHYNLKKGIFDNYSKEALNMANLALDDWTKIQAYDYQLPDWENGKWTNDGDWNFPIDSYVINQKSYANKFPWFNYSTAFSPNRDIDASKPFDSKVVDAWTFCWTGYGAYINANASLFIDLLYYSRIWDYAEKATVIGRDEQALESKNKVATGRKNLLFIVNAMNRSGAEEMKDTSLYVLYMQWKAFVGLGDRYKYSDAKSWGWSEGTFKFAESVYTEREKDFFKAAMRRNSLTTTFDISKSKLKDYPNKPIILPLGSNKADIGKEYSLYILRAQAKDGDIKITADNLPSGAKLIEERGVLEGDTDYIIKWTPSKTDAGKTYTINLYGESNMGKDNTTFTITVPKGGVPPVLDKIPAKTVYVGETLAFPLTVDNSFSGELSYEMEGDFGEVIGNAWNTAGIYTVTPEKHHVGAQFVSFSAKDSRGRVTTETALIHVKDNTAPTLKAVTQGVGPGARKNIYIAKAGEELKIQFDVSDIDGDEVKLSKSLHFPGMINDDTYTYIVTEDIAKLFPGPNVLTVTAKDSKGGETHSVNLVYFEEKSAPANHNPWAVPASNQTVISGTTVTLDASQSDDTDGDKITFKWEQQSGLSVKLSDDAAMKPTFTAPNVSEPTILKFYLTVMDSSGMKDVGVTRVQVLPTGSKIEETKKPMIPKENTLLQYNGVKYEAEDAKLSSAPIANGYIWFRNQNKYASVEWTVDVPTAGEYLANLKHKLTKWNLNVDVEVNSRKLDEKWKLTSMNENGDSYHILDLKSGKNTIKILAYHKKGLQIDNLQLMKFSEYLSGNGPTVSGNIKPEVVETVYQAEDGKYSGVKTEVNHAGYTGKGFANFLKKSGSSIEFTINTEHSGEHYLIFDYALQGNNRQLSLEVNGKVVDSKFNFVSNKSWRIWNERSIKVDLLDGMNSIKLTTTGEDGPNIDAMKVNAVSFE